MWRWRSNRCKCISAFLFCKYLNHCHLINYSYVRISMHSYLRLHLALLFSRTVTTLDWLTVIPRWGKESETGRWSDIMSLMRLNRLLVSACHRNVTIPRPVAGASIPRTRPEHTQCPYFFRMWKEEIPGREMRHQRFSIFFPSRTIY